MFHLVIATRDRRELLARTIQSVAEASRPDLVAGLWVVENGGGRIAEDICEPFRASLPIRYHNLTEPGLARAMQFALVRIRSGPVVFLDDDVRLCEGFLEAYDAAFRRHGPKQVYGGPVAIDYEGDPPPEWLLPHLPLSVRGFDGKSHRRFLGANFGLFAEEGLAAGGFDVRLGAGATATSTVRLVGEESDLQKRLYTRGLGRTLVEEAVLWHWVPAHRCTPEWTLDRLSREAATAAWQESLGFEGARLFGAPRWMFRKLLPAALERIRTGFSRDPRIRFEGAVEYRTLLARVQAARRRWVEAHDQAASATPGSARIRRPEGGGAQERRP